jgi:hypothetical protein
MYMCRMIKRCTYDDVPQELDPVAAISAMKALHVCMHHLCKARVVRHGV